MSLDFSQKPELRPLAELVGSLRSVSDPIGAQFLLIGAGARDLMLWHAFNIPATRQTMDVDFGVAVADWAAFEMLRRAVIDGGQFREDKGVAFHRFYHAASGLPVDVVPFGGIERATGPSPGRPPRTRSSTASVCRKLPRQAFPCCCRVECRCLLRLFLR